jgi:Ca2+-binding EF-hand superfamily protein
MKRMKDLERMIKLRFGNNYHSVRKAFLAMDSDRDGFLDVENFLAYFCNEKGINFDDLKKLITDKDSNKKGMLNYNDFSCWMGNAIH